MTERSMLLNFIVRGLGFLISFFYVPVLLGCLDNEEYGVWVTILMIVGWINRFDVGISGGLRNILTVEITKHDYSSARCSLMTAYVILSVIAFLIWSVLTLGTIFCGWNTLLNTSLNVNFVVFISYTFVCINFVIAVMHSVVYAHQKSEYVALTGLFSSVLMLGGVFLLRTFGYRGLTNLAIMLGITSFISMAVYSGYVFYAYPYMRPSFSDFDYSKVRKLVNLGVFFFIMQIGGLIMSATDNVITSNLFGPAEVTPFSIVVKLLGAVEVMYLMAITPIRSAMTKALVLGDWIWMKKTIFKLVLMIMGCVCVLLFLSYFFDDITLIWLHRKLPLADGLIPIVFVVVLIEIISYTCSEIMNGLGIIKIQVFTAIFQTCFNIPLSIYLAKNMGYGVVGIKLATGILFFVGAIIYASVLIWYFRNHRKMLTFNNMIGD